MQHKYTFLPYIVHGWIDPKMNSVGLLEADKSKKVVTGLEGVLLIKDDMLVHSDGEDHDRRLRALVERFREYQYFLVKNSGQKDKWTKRTNKKKRSKGERDKIILKKSLKCCVASVGRVCWWVFFCKLKYFTNFPILDFEFFLD